MDSTEQPTSDVIVARCDNCSAVLNGPYCAKCGQQATHYDRSVFLVLGDFLKELFDVDSRVFKSLLTLFFRPGSLSIEFRKNRRVRFVRPIRLYLFSSLILFLLFALTLRQGGDSPAEESEFEHEVVALNQERIATALRSIATHFERSNVRGLAEEVLKIESASELLYLTEFRAQQSRIILLAEQLQAIPQDLAQQRVNLRNLIGDAIHKKQQLQGLERFVDRETALLGAQLLYRPISHGNTFSMEAVSDLLDLLLTIEGEQEGELLDIEGTQEEYEFFKLILPYVIKFEHDPREVFDDLIEGLPIMMFLLLPVIVSILAIVQLGKGIRVVYQLIYAMHAHAVVFILLILDLALGFFIPNELVLGEAPVEFWIGLISTLLILVHTFWSFKNFYGSGIFVTTLKFFIVMMLYITVLTVALALNLLFTVLLL